MMHGMAETADWFVLVNPVSGGGRARRRWPALAEALGRRGISFECGLTAAARDGERLARLAVERGHRRLLAVGGDGTLNEMLNGVAPHAAGTPSECVIAAAPFGTGNDWARTMQVPDDPDRLAACLARGRTRRVDLAVVAGDDGRRIACHTVAGAGLDAAVLARTPSRGPRRLAYVAGLLRAIARFRAPRFRIDIDGGVREGRFWLALAAIGPRCGGGMRLAPRAEPDDGWLNLVTVEPLPLAAALARLPKLFDGRLAGDPAFTVTRCRAATIAAEPRCDVQVDGQRFGRTPVRISVIPGGLAALDCR